MADEARIESAWRAVLARLGADETLSKQTRGFLMNVGLRGTVGDDVLVITAQNERTKQVLEGELRQALSDAFADELGRVVSFAFLVDKDFEPAAVAPPAEETPVAEQPAPAAAPGYGAPRRDDDVQLPPSKLQRQRIESNLNPNHTFESFITGAGNRLAATAAINVAENLAATYNPLFIHGNPGLGKTHLLHAIGNYARSMSPNLIVRYANSEEFVNEFINTIGDNRTSRTLRPQFQERYRDVDILLIDDIQFLQGKDATIEEFFHTFNALHGSGKQVVISSDKKPTELTGFEQRLVSRFTWGLVTDIQPPDVETRIAILRAIAAHERKNVPDDVLELIASKISSNVRELEGAFTRLTASASLEKVHITTHLAETVLADFFTNGPANVVSIPEIIEATAEYFGFDVEDLTGKIRTRPLTRARQIAMYLSREMTDASLPNIGREFGGKDHTTVMHANKKIAEEMQKRREIYIQVTELTLRIKNIHR